MRRSNSSAVARHRLVSPLARVRFDRRPAAARSAVALAVSSFDRFGWLSYLSFYRKLVRFFASMWVVETKRLTSNKKRAIFFYGLPQSSVSSAAFHGKDSL